MILRYAWVAAAFLAQGAAVAWRHPGWLAVATAFTVAAIARELGDRR